MLTQRILESIRPAEQAGCDLPRVLIIAVGNESRGDDGLGPYVVEKLAQELNLSTSCYPLRVEIRVDFQLQIEFALDMKDRDMVLFIDARTAGGELEGENLTSSQGGRQGVRLSEVRPLRDASHSTHALSPQAVLNVFEQIEGEGTAPPSFVMSIAGQCFDLGTSLSPFALHQADNAMRDLRDLLTHPDPVVWRTRCS